LKKLVEISSGKSVAITPISSVSARTIVKIKPAGLVKSASSTSIEYKAKSLHFNARKLELDRIEYENQKIAKKIFQL
jgi:hypothetical protein